MTFLIPWFAFFFFSAGNDMLAIRSLYEEAALDSNKATSFHQMMEGLEVEGNPVLKGYKGASVMFMARSTWNPMTKLNYFSRGKVMLEEAIAKDKANLELRFLRYAVQNNCPSFLNYSASLDEDRSFILSNWKRESDRDLRFRVADYMSKDESLSSAERAAFAKERSALLTYNSNF